MRRRTAMWPSPDGTHLMYVSFNDSNVGLLQYPWFATGNVLTVGGVAQKPTTFPSSRTIRYPTVSKIKKNIDFKVLLMKLCV